MTAYQADFYTWTQQQAALLKAGRFAELDISNLIEEIESMGRSERKELESRLTVLLTHLLKWAYQPERRSRSWELTIKEQRLEYQETIAENPGLKSQLDHLYQQAYQKARLRAAKETYLNESVFPESCEWALDLAVKKDYFPE